MELRLLGLLGLLRVEVEVTKEFMEVIREGTGVSGDIREGSGVSGDTREGIEVSGDIREGTGDIEEEVTTMVERCQ